MKHLVKKYINEKRVSEDVIDLVNNTPINENEIKKISASKMDGYSAFAITNENEFIQTFQYLKNDKIFLFLEPDPIVLYFDNARRFHKIINDSRTKLFQKLSTPGYDFIAVNGDFYWYFATVSNYIVFLFLSLEAFINKIIPKDFVYKKEIGDKRTELYDKYQIQRNIDFIEKIKRVLPSIYNKNFSQEFGHKFELIIKLKNFRDDIVHTKSFEGKDSPNFYKELYVNSLNFEFDKTLFASKDFINYYQENLIEECKCGNEE